LRVRHVAASGCLLAALSFGVAACGSDDSDSGSSSTGSSAASTGSSTLTIYSSLPLQGDSRPQSLSVVNGEKLALEAQGGKVGNFTLKYVSLDDATAAAGKWDPGAVSSDARKAAQDKNTIAYLGEFNSGASAISIPILNEANILQVSPSNTATGLTRALGADKGEPDKYYPTGKRTYGRVVPADHIQGAAQVAYQQDNGCKSTYLLNDKEVYGAGLAKNVVAAAKTAGLNTAGNAGIDPKAANYRSVASTIKATGADCVFFGGITQNNAVQLWKDLNAAMPTAKLFGPDGVAESAFSEKIGSKAEKQTYITNPTLDPKLYPASGQAFFKEYKAKYGADPEPYAIYGYEAMSVALQAIKDAGAKGNDRQAVIDAFYKIKNRESVLGTYSIDENGDTTLTDYGGNRIEGGKLVFDKVIKAQTAG
jgi:branched-chain amino acid transport system substrate-binding protein